jgi:hypothetical protein
VAGSAARYDPTSRATAVRMTTMIGPETQSSEAFLDALGYAYACHMQSLKKRGCGIIMAPSIAFGLDSMPAAERRGRVLTAAEREHVEREYAPDSGVMAIYSSEIDALVMPTSRIAPDHEHLVLHEVGHALTLPAAMDLSPALLGAKLPPDLRAHVEHPGYGGDQRIQLAELLAETYAWMIVGRMEELPPPVLSVLVVSLSASEQTPRRKF